MIEFLINNCLLPAFVVAFIGVMFYAAIHTDEDNKKPTEEEEEPTETNEDDE